MEVKMSRDQRGMETQFTGIYFLLTSKSTADIESINHTLQNSSEDSGSCDTFNSSSGFKWAGGSGGQWFGNSVRMLNWVNPMSIDQLCWQHPCSKLAHSVPTMENKLVWLTSWIQLPLHLQQICSAEFVAGKLPTVWVRPLENRLQPLPLNS